MEVKATQSTSKKIREMTIISMFSAIILIMIFVPFLGLITIPDGPSITLIHIPVLIGGAMLGRKAGFFLGAVFGIGTLIRALYSFGFDYLFIFPWVSVLPRIIFGFLIFDVTRLIQKIIKPRLLALTISFALLTFIHTMLVLPMLVTTFPIALGNGSIQTILEQGEGNVGTVAFIQANNSWNGLMLIISGTLVTNGIIEIILAGSIGAVVADRLIAYRKANDFTEIKGEPEDASLN